MDGKEKPRAKYKWGDFPDIQVIWWRRQYLKRKYRLAIMYPCKKVIWRLSKLVEDLESTLLLNETDIKYWKKIKPLIDESARLAEVWRREFNLGEGKHVIKESIRKVFIEDLPPDNYAKRKDSLL